LTSRRSNNDLLIGFPDYQEAAQRLARAADIPYAEALIHHFPDGETRLQLPESIPENVVLCQTLDHPNSKLVELVLAAATARNLGARRITLIAPYLCYMRQDKAFHPGEAISQRIIGTLLSYWIDTLITVDSHLHRVHQLKDAVPVDPAINLNATTVMSAFLGEQLDNPFLVGPDGSPNNGSPPLPATGTSITASRTSNVQAISKCISACQRQTTITVMLFWLMTLPAPVAHLKKQHGLWPVLNLPVSRYWSPMPCSSVTQSNGYTGQVSVTSGALIASLTPAMSCILISCWPKPWVMAALLCNRRSYKGSLSKPGIHRLHRVPRLSRENGQW